MQSQRTDGEIKTSFNFIVNICKYVPKNGIKSSIHPPFITTKQRRVTKNYSFWVFAILCHFYFGLQPCISSYCNSDSICGPYAYAV